MTKLARSLKKRKRRRVTDTFTDINRTLQTHVADTGQIWSIAAGGFSIVSNRAETTGAGQNSAFIESGLANCVIELYAPLIGQRAGGIAFRRSGDSFFLTNLSGDDLQLYWTPDLISTATLLATLTNGFLNSTSKRLRVTLNGSSLSFGFTDTGSVTITDARNISATQHGLRGNASACVFDDLTIV